MPDELALIICDNDGTEIIATLLNDGLHQKTGSRILKKETVDGKQSRSLAESGILDSPVQLKINGRQQCS